MNLLTKVIISILIFSISIFFITPSSFAMTGDENKVVIIAVDRLSFNDFKYSISNFENISHFVETGAIALMNTNTGGRINTENAYATLGAGARALGGKNANLGFNILEKHQQHLIKDIYFRHYGFYPETEVVFLGLPATVKENQSKNYNVTVGSLGEILSQTDKKVAVLGNSDTFVPQRFAPLAVTDFSGRAGQGKVNGDILINDSHFPFGIRIDGDKVFSLFNNYHKNSHFVLVEWGDFYRLDEYAGNLTEERYRELFSENLAYLDLFLKNIMASLEPGTLLMLLSPSPSLVDIGSGRTLTPVVFWGDRIEEGLLVSATTRREGIITNLDISATTLDFLRVNRPFYMLGEKVYVQPFSNGVTYLGQRLLEIDRVYRQRPPVIQVYIFFQILVVLAALYGIFTKAKKAYWIKPLMLSLLLIPLIILLLSLFPPWSLSVTIVVTYGSALLLGLMLYYLSSFKKNMIIISGATSLILLLDVLTNSSLIKKSFLGYDPVAGARYYGIGNEFMGVLIGSTLLALTAALQFYPKGRKYLWLPFVIYYLLMAFILASPAYGANFGGTLTALAAGLVTILLMVWRKKGYSNIFFGAIGFLVVLTFFFWINLPGEGRVISHWGRSITAIGEGGIEEVINIILRKSSMNLRLMRYSLWSRVFLSFLLAQGILLFRPVGVLKEVRSRYPVLMAGIIGITGGSAAAFFTNDSGVVAAATSLLYGSLPLLYLALNKVLKSVKG